MLLCFGYKYVNCFDSFRREFCYIVLSIAMCKHYSMVLIVSSVLRFAFHIGSLFHRHRWFYWLNCILLSVSKQVARRYVCPVYIRLARHSHHQINFDNLRDIHFCIVSQRKSLTHFFVVKIKKILHIYSYLCFKFFSVYCYSIFCIVCNHCFQVRRIVCIFI